MKSVSYKMLAICKTRKKYLEKYPETEFQNPVIKFYLKIPEKSIL